MHLYKRLRLAILMAGLLKGQSADISGYIFDPSGRPVSGAVVACGDSSAQTQTDGSFHLSGFSACQATITRPGFSPQTAALSGSNNRIALTLAGLAQSVVVSATRGETSVEQAGVAAHIVTAEDLKQRQFPFVLDVLREMAGSQIVKTGRYGGITTLFTRGAPANGTLVLLD